MIDISIKNLKKSYEDGLTYSFTLREGVVFSNGSALTASDVQFTFEQAMQQSVAVKGAGISHNSVKMMLKNWHKQGLVVMIENGKYRKTSENRANKK